MADISGTVFRDFNANGRQDNTAAFSEPGVAGITVTAYDAVGAVAGAPDTTDANGAYTLTGLTAGTDYRVEFTGVPDYLKAGACNKAGVGDNETTVAFAQDGAANINASLSNPSDYCQDDPDLVITRFAKGARDGAFPASADSTVLQYNYGDISVPRSVMALPLDVGAVYGVAHVSKANVTLVSSYFKRHADLGPEGVAAIYRIDRTAGTVSRFSVLDSGDPRNAGAGYDWNHDSDGFSDVGKIGLGDIELSDDQKTLFTVNMSDRKLYTFAVDATASEQAIPSGSYDIPTNACSNAADARPMGLGFHDGQLYVGVTCSAESTVEPNNADDSRNGPRWGDPSRLAAFIYRFDPSAHSFTQVLDIPLDYARGCINEGALSDPANETCDPEFHADWLPWQPDYDIIFGDKAPGNKQGWDGAPFAAGYNPSEYIEYPQPLLSDITFDNDGSMIVMLRDLNGDRTGYLNNSPNPADTDTHRGNAMGDVLRACGNAQAGWTLESNGVCGGVTTGGAGNHQGPDDGEYYWQDNGPGGPGTTGNGDGGHSDTFMGGLLHIPGYMDNVSGSMDTTAYWESGLVWFRNDDGTTVLVGGNPKRLRVSEDDSNWFYGKAGGIGDIEALCEPAPIEIGNFVWNDQNHNGIQDPGESPLNGVTVLLFEGATQVGSAVTDAQGQFYFGGINDTNMTSGSIKPETAYQLRISLTDAQLNNMIPTSQGQGTNLHDNNGDNGVANTGYSTIAFTTDVPGANDHTLDFGFTSAVALGNRVWLDDGAGGGTVNNGVQDGSEAGIANVDVALHDGTGALVGSTTTDASGYYYFDNLLPGDYYVEIPSSEFAAGQPLQNLSNATGADGTTTTDLSDNGIDDANPAANGIRSNSFTLSVGGEPTGEDQSAYPGSLPDNSVNATNDFGFYQSNASIGNYVWHDDDADGIQDAEESGIAGVTVELLNEAGAVIDSTTTDGNGFYQFADLIAGNYEIRFVTLPGYSFTAQNQGSGALQDSFDSDANVATGRTGVFSLAAGENNKTIDAGMTLASNAEPASLGDRVWYDTDGDGVQDAGEPGIGGVTVTLYAATDLTTPLASVVSDASGHYSFQGLSAGDYVVHFAAPANYVVSPAGQTAGNADSDPDPTTGFTPAITLVAGDNNTNVDAGMHTQSGSTLSIGDYVWNDLNGDGVQDAGEPGLSGVDVVLFDALGNELARVTTPASGLYQFTNLPPGDYRVEVDTTTLPVAMNQTGDPDTTFDSAHDLVSLNADTLVVDFGYQAQGAALSLEKSTNGDNADTAPGQTIAVGSPVTWTYRVENLGNVALTAIAVTDDQLADADISCPVDDNDNVIDDLAVSAVVTCTATGVAVSGQYANIGTASGTPPSGPPVTDTDPSHYFGEQIDLELTKTVSAGPHAVGGTVTFTIHVLNNGPSNATGVAVQDVVPNGYANIGSISSGGTESGGTITWSGLSIASGGSLDLTFQAMIQASGDYINVAQVSAADQGDSDSTPGNNVPDEDDQDTAVVTPGELIDLELTKTVSAGPHTVGGTVTFTIHVLNNGPSNATGVAVQDVVPNGYAGISNISNGGTEAGGTITWSGLSIANGGSVDLTFQAVIQASGSYTNVAQVTAADQPDSDSTPGNNVPDEDDQDTAVVTPGELIDLELTKAVSAGPHNVGDTVTFTLHVLNNGPSNATGVAVQDVVPNGYASIGNISNGGTEAGGTITWSGLSVANGVSVDLTFQAVIQASGDYSNVAQVTAADQDDSDSMPGNNVPDEDDQDTAVVTPGTPMIDLNLVKTVSGGPTYVAGDVVTFTLTLANAGPGNATGVEVTDPVPDGFDAIAGISNGGVLSGNTVVWSGLDIAAGASLALHFDARLLASGNHLNIAEVTGANETDTDSTPGNQDPNEDDIGDVELPLDPGVLPPPTEVPTLSGWLLMLLGMLLAGIGAGAVGRRQR